MSFLNTVLKTFVGDKNKKDLKLLQPVISKVNMFDEEMSKLSNDALREKTNSFKQKIIAGTLECSSKIKALEEEAIEANIDRKEEIYDEIDRLEDESYEISEEILNEILPEAFALIKETSKRFTENESITVTATPFDRELSAAKNNSFIFF